MSEVMQSVREIISDVCDIPIDEIQPGVHVLQELGVDSVDFLDVVHEIDRKYEITLPVEDWANAVNRGEPDTKYFVIDRIVEHIEHMLS
jgi:acyl carrier protein